MTLQAVSGNFGGKTVFDKKTGKYISISAEQLKSRAERKAAQAAEKAAKDMGRVGNKTIFNEATGLWESAAGNASPKSKIFKNAAQETAEAGFFTKLGSKLKSGLKTAGEAIKNGASKIGNFAKGKGGKIALVAAAAAALVAGGIYLYNKFKNNNNAAPDKKPDLTPTPVKPKKPAKPDEPVAPKKPDKPVKPTKPVIKPGVIEPGQGEYKVVKGDNVWNIAKKDLIANNKEKDYKPTNAEIAKRTKELLELNNLKYEKDNYTVLIYADQELKLR